MNQTLNPQNPFGSYLVSASAGSGKTFQLSRRFLFLVGAGALPHHILTITFTRKAASEMRSRIMRLASELMQGGSFAREFREQLEQFATAASMPSSALLTPEETGRRTLQASQRLKISTIDSIYNDWVRRFPWEVRHAFADGKFPSPFELASKLELQELEESAWRRLVQQFSTGGLSQDVASVLEQGLLSARNIVSQLQRHDTYLWLCQMQQRGAHAIHPFLPEWQGEKAAYDEHFWTTTADAWREFSAHQKPEIADKVLTAINNKDLQALRECKVVTQKNTLSGTFLRGKKADLLATERETIDHALAESCLVRLDEVSRQYARIFVAFQSALQTEKHRAKKLDFSDLIRGCYQLFNDPDAAGASYLLHQGFFHLLMDEFQDTSQLQWEIFSACATELMSGAGIRPDETGPEPSVFIVGDVKQSIYGFREADPAVMQAAAQSLGNFGLKTIELNRSYRSAQVVLDVVTSYFTEADPQFPKHCTAQNDGKPVIPDFGSVTVVEPIFADQDSDERAIEREAELVAQWLEQKLANKSLHTFDKDLQATRPIIAGDCAILYRNATHAKVFEEALHRHGLSCVRDAADGYFARPELDDMQAFLKLGVVPNDVSAICTILRSPLCFVDDEAMFKALDQTSESTSRVTAILESLINNGWELQWLKQLLPELRMSTPYAFYAKLYETRAVLPRYQMIFGQVDGEIASGNLVQWLELLSDLESNGTCCFTSVAHAILRLKAENQLGNAPTTASAIRLMTIHSSKGLEFPLVVLVDSHTKWEKADHYWAKGCNADGDAGLFYLGKKDDQPTCSETLNTLQAANDAELSAESSRLLYVALTRAQHHLLITGSGKKRSTKAKDKESAAADSMLLKLRDSVQRLGADNKEFGELTALVLEHTQVVGNNSNTIVPTTTAVTTPLHTTDQWIDNVVQNSKAADSGKPENLRALSRDILSVSPHALRQTTNVTFSLVSDEDCTTTESANELYSSWARLQGVYIHYGLECAIKDISPPTQQTWKRLILEEQVSRLPADESFAAWQVAETELHHVLASNLWKNLTSQSQWMEAEYPIVHLTEKRDLVRGSIDLLVKDQAGTIQVIDFKTGQHQGVEDLQTHAPQILAYAAAVTRIFPSTPVTAFILCTKNLQLYKLEHST